MAISGRKSLLFASVAGICSGLLVHATLSSLGLSAVLQTSPQLFSAMKFAGAAYLIYLGVCGLQAALRETFGKGATEDKDVKVNGRRMVTSEFNVGFMTNILNPKVALFYLTFLPQFIDPSKNLIVQAMLLSAGHILMSIIWLLLIGTFVAYFKSQLEKPRLRQVMEAVTGLALIGFGLSLLRI